MLTARLMRPVSMQPLSPSHAPSTADEVCEYAAPAVMLPARLMRPVSMQPLSPSHAHSTADEAWYWLKHILCPQANTKQLQNMNDGNIP